MCSVKEKKNNDIQQYRKIENNYDFKRKSTTKNDTIATIKRKSEEEKIENTKLNQKKK